MTQPTLLAATWSDGVFVFGGETQGHELAGRSVRAVARQRNGAVLAVVDGRSVCRRTPFGVWSTLARTEVDIACVLAVPMVRFNRTEPPAPIYVGTDNARVLKLTAAGEAEVLTGFDTVAGRESWYAGTALVNGHLVGPPLGVRSLTATADGAVLLANVHVGGIPRSTDGGGAWHPTIEIDSDVHEVRAHPFRPNVVAAAAAVGLCISHNGGMTWTVESDGLHAPYCSAVAFVENDVVVAAATDHFAREGAVYRRPIDGRHRLERVAGLPDWLEGIVDTSCIGVREAALAIADKGGNLYSSADAGRSWVRRAGGLPAVSAVAVL